MPDDDLILKVRQVSQYPVKAAAEAKDAFLLQEGGLGGPYKYTNSFGILAPLSSLPVPPDADLPQMFTNNTVVNGAVAWNAYTDTSNAWRFWGNGPAYVMTATVNGFMLSWAPNGQIGAMVTWEPLFTVSPTSMIYDGIAFRDGTITVARDPISDLEVATLRSVLNLIFNEAVRSFNGQRGDIIFRLEDMVRMGAAPRFNPQLCGDARLDGSPLVTLRDANRLIEDHLGKTPFVHLFNGRAGQVWLKLKDIVKVGGAPIWSPPFRGKPTAPTPGQHDHSDRIATTRFVRRGLSLLEDDVTAALDQSQQDLRDYINGLFAGLTPPVYAGPEPPDPRGDIVLWFDTEEELLKAWDGDHWIPIGAQGPAGPQGPKGDPGQGLVVKGTVPNSSSLPSSGNQQGDTWIAQDTGHGWVYNGTGWIDIGAVQGPQGIQGPPGPAGGPGPTGPAGQDSTVPGPTGPAGPAGPPGQDSTVPGPPGATGPAGPQGPQGNPGSGINVKGSVENSSHLPGSGNEIGDLWIADDTGHGWVWDGSDWIDAGPIRGPEGPPGPAGPAGPQGEHGLPGVPGPAGNAGPQGQPGDAAEILTVASASNLPATGETNQIVIAQDTGQAYIWNGSQWVPSGSFRGPQGNPGPPGNAGAQGPPGPNTSLTQPPSPSSGQQWLDGNVLKVWDGGMWVTVSGGANISMEVNPPANPEYGNFWWDGVGGQLYIFDAEDQWVVVVNQPGGAGGGGATRVIKSASAPADASEGDLWWDTVSNELYVWAANNQWVIAVNVPDVRMGVTDGSSAAAGEIGEILSVTLSAPSPVYDGWYQIGNMSLTLPPGSWDVRGGAWASATIPAGAAGTPFMMNLAMAVGGTERRPFMSLGQSAGTVVGTYTLGGALSPTFIDSSTNTTITLNGQKSAAAVDASVTNANIWARRMR